MRCDVQMVISQLSEEITYLVSLASYINLEGNGWFRHH